MKQTKDVPARALAALTALMASTALGAAAPLDGQERIEERRALQANATVEIRTESHEIQVETWDRNEIELLGSYDPDREVYEVRGGGRSLTVQIRSDRDRRGGRTTGARTLTVRVPAGVRFEGTSVSGRVSADGLRGAVSLNSVSGALAARNLEAETVSLNTVSGAVTFQGSARELRANSVSGALRLNGEASAVSAKTVSGRVEVAGSPAASRIELNSVSGQIRFSGGLARDGALRAESHSGAVEIDVPRGVDARFRLSTFSGSVSADLAGMEDVDRRRSRYTPEESMTFVVGGGAGRIEVHSFSGNVRVRQASR